MTLCPLCELPTTYAVCQHCLPLLSQPARNNLIFAEAEFQARVITEAEMRTKWAETVTAWKLQGAKL